jgi:methylated-DNA-[protein]-cysteine S-methyltransferase
MMSTTTDPSAAELFAPLPATDPPAQRRLHNRLARGAEEADLLDVAYRTLDTAVGALLLAATAHGLVRVAFYRQDHTKVLESLATAVSPRILEAPRRLDPAAREIEEYLAGTRRAFDLPLDLRLARGFRLGVLRHLPEIAYGRTETYAQVAAAAGSPRAVRAVGTACSSNPLPLVVPCHRVVRSDGSYGAYAGGADLKRVLLTMEAATG